MSLKSKPHYTLPAEALADWVESQPDRWWAVDGDPYLMSVVDFPCPGDELAPEIRRVGKDLLVWDKAPNSQAQRREDWGRQAGRPRRFQQAKAPDDLLAVLD